MAGIEKPLSLLRARDPESFDASFQRLTAERFTALQAALAEQGFSQDSSVRLLATAILRRVAQRMHAKMHRAPIVSVAEAEDTLKKHSLPSTLQQRLIAKYGGDAPQTWFDAMQRLRELAEGSKERFWQLVDGHPIVEYVHAQCQHCGYKIPDDGNVTPADDEALGLSMVEPTEDERPFVCGGWFRGPRPAKVFELSCGACGGKSRWFRSQHPEIILNPHAWGRLCGEQQTLQAWLADYFGVEHRAALPLDWDHIWVECRYDPCGRWHVLDPPSRNFASRLDEGIGAWTRVLAFGREESACCDVSEEYLRSSDDGGRLDAEKAKELPRWHSQVEAAREDASGMSTQTRSVCGHVIRLAQLTPEQVTEILQQAYRDAGHVDWWIIE